MLVNQSDTGEGMHFIVNGLSGAVPVFFQDNRAESFEIFLISRKAIISDMLQRYGAILFRGFNVNTVEIFERALLPIIPSRSEYVYRSTSRTSVAENIYTSTEYPADQSIPLHNENAYSTHIPDRIAFCCITEPSVGGETPLADSRIIFNNLPPDLRERFREKKIKYSRHYGQGLDLSWQEAFQTQSKTGVDEVCKKLQLNWEWLGGDRLRTWQICEAVSAHPETQESVWLNQAHLFHYSALPLEIQAYLLEKFGLDSLPRNSYYGDGSAIDPEDIAVINETYSLCAMAFHWERGDVLLLDNRLMAHGRRPFIGDRKIVVAMGASV